MATKDPADIQGGEAYARLIHLAAESAFVVSDSGGMQEEVSVLKRPLIVVRNSTERPEVHGTFATLVPPGPRIGELLREVYERQLDGEVTDVEGARELARRLLETAADGPFVGD